MITTRSSSANLHEMDVDKHCEEEEEIGDRRRTQRELPVVVAVVVVVVGWCQD